MSITKEMEEKLNQFKQNGCCPECKFLSFDQGTGKPLGSKEHLAYAGTYSPGRECSVANIQAKKEREVREVRDIPSTFSVSSDTSHGSLEDPEDVHEVEELGFSAVTPEEIDKALDKLKEEPTGTAVEEEESDFVKLNSEEARQKEVREKLISGIKGFSTVRETRGVAIRTEEDVLAEYGDLADNIFFELRDRTFTAGVDMKRTTPPGDKRDWMSDGLLEVVKKIEKHWERDVQFPDRDFDWLAIIKRVKFLLEDNKVIAPIEMVTNDIRVLNGKVEKYLFKKPSLVETGK